MKLFEKIKRPKKSGFLIHLTTIDGKVIVRKGQELTDKLLEDLLRVAAKNGSTDLTVGESFVFENLREILRKEKYRFIVDTGRTGEMLLQILAGVKLNTLLLKELQWMKHYDYFYHHTLAITLLVTRLAMDYWDEPEQVNTAAFTALTHDVGITRVPENILMKLSALDEEEKAYIRQHPFYSYALLSYYLKDYRSYTTRLSLEHHEDPLGTGYPRGIRQQSVLLQMIKMADIFDALISNRPFRPAMPFGKALSVFEGEVNTGRISPELPVLLRSYLLPYLKKEYHALR